jgi:MSHA biogenesis protein MshO
MTKTRASGFTLIELVVTLLLLGILAAGITRFISIGTDIYVDVAGREQLLSESRFALERMTRDIRRAVPNSIRTRTLLVGGAAQQCLELLPIKGSGSYLNMPIGQSGSVAEVIRLNDYSFSSGDQLLVYPLISDHVYGNGRRFSVSDFTDVPGETDVQQFTFTASVAFDAASPLQRFYLAAEPISYCLRAGSLYLHRGYGYQQVQPVFSNGGQLMAQQISNQPLTEPLFIYSGGTQNRNALVIIRLRLTRADDNETLAYNHEVQVPNVP